MEKFSQIEGVGLESFFPDERIFCYDHVGKLGHDGIRDSCPKDPVVIACMFTRCVFI